jgi:hypothetical protein
MESEPRSEEGEVKDVKVDIADPKIPPPCDPSSPALSEKLQDLDVNIFVSGASVGSTVSQLLPGSAEPPGKSVSEETKFGLEITDTQPAVHQSHGENVPKTPAPKDITSDIAEVSGNEKVEGVSEVNTAAEGKRTEGEPLNKPELGTEKVTSPKTPVKVIPAGKTPTRAEPENMNVLTLEKEVHNEYFQAPLLGQSLALKAQAGKDLALSLRRTGETTPDVLAADPDKSPLPTPANEPEGEDTDADISELSEPKKDKPGELLYDRLRSYSLRTITSPSTTWTELTGGCPLDRRATDGSAVPLVGKGL